RRRLGHPYRRRTAAESRARENLRDLLQLRAFTRDARQLRLPVHREPRLQQGPRSGECVRRTLPCPVLERSHLTIRAETKALAATCISDRAETSNRRRNPTDTHHVWECARSIQPSDGVWAADAQAMRS